MALYPSMRVPPLLQWKTHTDNCYNFPHMNSNIGVSFKKSYRSHLFSGCMTNFINGLPIGPGNTWKVDIWWFIDICGGKCVFVLCFVFIAFILLSYLWMNQMGKLELRGAALFYVLLFGNGRTWVHMQVYVYSEGTGLVTSCYHISPTILSLSGFLL